MKNTAVIINNEQEINQLKTVMGVPEMTVPGILVIDNDGKQLVRSMQDEYNIDEALVSVGVVLDRLKTERFLKLFSELSPQRQWEVLEKLNKENENEI